ncbi:PD-(D/E)XK nuclease family protein, partial [Candidatus Poribacteria bacterium]|nr:PD-(D/E)XK nuclease family protein [Candidatus Poribacteria bacterium]
EQGEERAEAPLLPSTPSPAFPARLLPSLRLIAHNVRVEKSRTVTHELLEYEGYLRRDLLSPASQRSLENERERVYSISELERYGRCPFRYFAHTLTPKSTEDDDDEGEDLTHRQKGELLHTILFEFYHNRRDQSPLSASTDAEFEAAVQELRALAQAHLGRSKKDGLFWEIDVVETLIGGHGRAGTLPTFLAEERKRKFDVHPHYFEVQFGHRNMMSERVDSILSCVEPIQVGEVSLSGRVDRVELGDGVFTVGDYKTGSYTPKIRDILEGRSLQLPLYLFAIEQLLRKHPPGAFRGVGGVYYTLREDYKTELGIGEREYNGKAFRAGPTSGQLLPNSAQGVQSLQAIIDLAIEHANRYVRSIVNGEFPLTSHDKKLVCRSCPFKKSCRVGAIVDEESET